MNTLNKDDISNIGAALSKMNLDLKAAMGVLNIVKNNGASVADARKNLATALTVLAGVSDWNDVPDSLMKL